MVLAGAGSGKTRVLVHRIASLVDRGTDPHRILAVTFTNKAAGEMRERLSTMLEGEAGAMWIGTFHATCARILRRYGERVGLSRYFTIFDDDDQKKLMTGLLKEHGYAEQVNARSLLWRIDRAKNRGEDPMDIEVEGPADEALRQMYPIYRERMAAEDAVDFNDILLKVHELNKDPEIGPRLADRFEHVLVDEFQDTNRVQYRLVSHFASGAGNLTVVGDDDQSIYSWRGAEPRNLLDFDRDFPNAEVIKLEQNYRSTQTILAAANAVIARNVDRHAKELWTQRESGEPVLWEETHDERAEATFVAQGIRGLFDEEGRDYSDVAVLYRTHAQSRALEEALRAHGIAYKVIGSTSFFQRKEIKDIRAYLKLVLNGAADTCFERVVNTPTRGIGKTTIARIANQARPKGLSLFDGAREAAAGQVDSIGPAARKKIAGFVALIDGLRELLAQGPSVSETLVETINRSGYRERLEADDTGESQDRVENLGQLVAMATDFDEDHDGKGTLIEFEERISLSAVADSEDGRGSGAITLMTIHAAKGLEFPVVFLCGMEDGLFPSVRASEWGVEDREELEEERRLAYVAITRAEDRLVLTAARTRRTWKEVKMNRPSRFIDDIPAELMAVRARPERAAPSRSRLERGSSAAYRRRAQESNEFSDPVYDDVAQPTFGDDVPVYELDGDGPGAFSRGAAVRHKIFGVGRVLDSSHSSNGPKLTVEFPTAGVKTILARFVTPLA